MTALDGRGLLLDFDGSVSLRALAERCHGRITYLAVDARERLGLSAVLVRPDGFVAWAAAAGDAFEGAAPALWWTTIG